MEGSGCRRLELFEGEVFDIGENGQETAGRHACLKRLRLTEEADTFVHSLGRCELWHCGTLARVRMSAGPGGGLSESPYAIALKTASGRYITAAEDGTMRADEQAFVPEALFLLMPGSGGRFVLRAQNDRYLKAEPGGHLAAVTEKWDDWEEFEIVQQDAGKLALRTFHDTYVSANRDGFVSAVGYSTTPETMLELVNRSSASLENSSELVQFHKTVSDPSSHAVCSRPGSKLLFGAAPMKVLCLRINTAAMPERTFLKQPPFASRVVSSCVQKLRSRSALVVPVATRTSRFGPPQPAKARKGSPNGGLAKGTTVPLCSAASVATSRARVASTVKR